MPRRRPWPPCVLYLEHGFRSSLSERCSDQHALSGGREFRLLRQTAREKMLDSRNAAVVEDDCEALHGVRDRANNEVSVDFLRTRNEGGPAEPRGTEMLPLQGG
jgi:hypothetical protein